MHYNKKAQPRRKNSINPPINPGISLLIVVFLVLCLFTFSAITLASAINEYKRSETLAENTKEYYNASNKAEQALSAEMSLLSENGEWTIPAARTFTYDINEASALEVTIEPLTEPEEDRYFNITRWKVVQKQVWEADDTMNLIIP